MIKDNKEADLDHTLKNIRQELLSKGIRYKGVSVEMIDQIYRFENLNDLDKEVDVDEVVRQTIERSNLHDQHDLKKKRKRAHS